MRHCSNRQVLVPMGGPGSVHGAWSGNEALPPVWCGGYSGTTSGLQALQVTEVKC